MARAQAAADNPRELFRDLPRDPDVPFLWGHQDRILERYEAHVDTSEIALELPTGTGKTLIGLLIAEWRRRERGERALYLCPTRQLAHQVAVLAGRYGIDAEVSLRPSYEGLDRWNNGDTVAISTYSALFDYKPKFTAPQALILDDAHDRRRYRSDDVDRWWGVTCGRPMVRRDGLCGRDASHWHGNRMLCALVPVAPQQVTQPLPARPVRAGAHPLPQPGRRVGHVASSRLHGHRRRRRVGQEADMDTAASRSLFPPTCRDRALLRRRATDHMSAPLGSLAADRRPRG